MPARLVPLAGTAAGLVLVLVLVLGVALELPVLAALAGGLLGVGILAVQLDSWRRVRSLRNYLRDEIRRVSGTPDQGYAAVPAAPAPAAQSDLLGAVQVLQAQYTGRLDRMQVTLDEALDQLAGRPDHDPR
ncbi:hypothetical protein SGUI_1904 [Serinicoccus hydrothermalis]|uniref:Uncharacterized protein n=1 Tax=Serinicoccus hydrothermalis TaxID=1758689 RepID=A0A1B1NCW7_9MICO|nr:hypothetical protein [Serinicoccus hydrothermalis]ANS79300.1 hypothetical protein SGUI_1904 [Serinicoccus hydrothermalis]